MLGGNTLNTEQEYSSLSGSYHIYSSRVPLLGRHWSISKNWMLEELTERAFQFLEMATVLRARESV